MSVEIPADCLCVAFLLNLNAVVTLLFITSVVAPSRQGEEVFEDDCDDEL